MESPPPNKKDRVQTDSVTLLLLLALPLLLLRLVLGLLLRLLLLLQLARHTLICLFAVQVREDDVKHLRVPADRASLDALLDVLYAQSVSIAASTLVSKRGKLTSGNSSQSDILSCGNTIILQPARLAATVFSLNPPILNTLPVSVSSPVIATVGSTGVSSASESNDVAIVIPADGPSFCTAPSGTCT